MSAKELFYEERRKKKPDKEQKPKDALAKAEYLFDLKALMKVKTTR